MSLWVQGKPRCPVALELQPTESGTPRWIQHTVRAQPVNKPGTFHHSALSQQLLSAFPLLTRE